MAIDFTNRWKNHANVFNKQEREGGELITR